MKQRTAWGRDGVKVFARPLRYPKNWPYEKPLEKGVDVALAVDLVFNAARRFYDVAVVASTDTDLMPALEAVCELRRAWGKPQLEVTCWSPLTKRLRVDGYSLWCHRLGRSDYESVRDKTNYTI
jgi:NYN domain